MTTLQSSEQPITIMFSNLRPGMMIVHTPSNNARLTFVLGCTHYYNNSGKVFDITYVTFPKSINGLQEDIGIKIKRIHGCAEHVFSYHCLVIEWPNFGRENWHNEELFKNRQFSHIMCMSQLSPSIHQSKKWSTCPAGKPIKFTQKMSEIILLSRCVR